MNPDSTTNLVCPRWLHALAVLTVLLTLPLLFLGAGVTSHGVGMVDPRGFRPPWEIIKGLFENSGLGFRLEYGHRTFGFLVGMCGIGLAGGCWFFDRRPWMGWLGVLALGMICLQGLLGIFRVDYNALNGRTYALIHGIFAQLVFAVLVSIAIMTSRHRTAESSGVASPALQRWSIIVSFVIFGQLVLGGLVRHTDSMAGPRGHLLGAFVVVGVVVWLLMVIREQESRDQFKLQRVLLMTLLTVQLLLGMESWLAKFFLPQADLPQLTPVPMHAEWVRTAHYLVGSMMFATTVAVALIALRKPVLLAEAAPARPRELEGAL
jgi:cytochrome c oxidase assembly protein subunit 15